MKVYLYNQEYAKQNGTYTNFFKYLGFAFTSMFSFIIILTIAIIIFIDDYPFTFILFGIVLVLFICWWIKLLIQKQIYLSAAKTGYVLDSNDDLYCVNYLGNPSVVSSLAHLAGLTGLAGPLGTILSLIFSINENQTKEELSKQENLFINYVLKIKSEKSIGNPVSAGEARIILLNNKKIIKERKKYTICSYTNAKGKYKKIKIIKAFPGLEEAIDADYKPSTTYAKYVKPKDAKGHTPLAEHFFESTVEGRLDGFNEIDGKHYPHYTFTTKEDQYISITDMSSALEDSVIESKFIKILDSTYPKKIDITYNKKNPQNCRGKYL